MTRWRVVPYAEYGAFMNMAIDEAVGESVAAGECLPTIRFYGWSPRAVSIGYFQSMEREVDVRRCAESGVDVVRRRTGGGAVFHDSEITYSIIGAEGLFPKDIIASYRAICGHIITALGSIGISAEFKPINDITVAGRKISGNAQTRRGGVLLQHGTLLYEVDVDRMFSLLRVPDEKIRDKAIATAKERVTSVRAQAPGVSREEACEALMDGFSAGRRCAKGALTDAELARAKELAETRYSKKEWNFSR